MKKNFLITVMYTNGTYGDSFANLSSTHSIIFKSSEERVFSLHVQGRIVVVTPEMIQHKNELMFLRGWVIKNNYAITYL